MRAVLAVLALTGCNQIFGLHDVSLVGDADPCTVTPGQPTFHDEDGDQINDGCDNCPDLANPGQEDDDGDHVGNACDPELSARDSIFRFIPFDQPTDSLEWTGPWTFAADDVRYTASTNTTEELEIFHGAVPARPFAIDAHVVVDATMGTTAQIALIGNGDASTGVGASCTVIGLPPSLQARENATNLANGAITGYSFAGGTAFRLRMVFFDDHLTCVVAVDGGTGANVTDTLPAPPPTGTFVLDVVRTAARFDDLTIYQLGR